MLFAKCILFTKNQGRPRQGRPLNKPVRRTPILNRVADNREKMTTTNTQYIADSVRAKERNQQNVSKTGGSGAERRDGGESPLGNYTKFVFNNCEEKAFQDIEEQQKIRNRPRRQKWRNQQAAARLLANTKQSRVSTCMKTVAWREPGVRIEVLDREDRARYAGLTLCGNVWTCPCCSQNISAHRADEANKALAWARAKIPDTSSRGRAEARDRPRATPMMLTLTVRHGRKDSLEDLTDRLVKAKQRFFRSKTWRRLRMTPIWQDEHDQDGRAVMVEKVVKSRMVQAFRQDGTPRNHRDGTPILQRERLERPETIQEAKKKCVGFEKDGKIFGAMIAFEITHTAAGGWHPHFHIILLVDTTTQKQARKILGPLRAEWFQSLKTQGLFAKGEAGFRLDGADQAGEYVSKFGAGTGLDFEDKRTQLKDAIEKKQWGLVEELTRSRSKVAENGKKGSSPWQLLEQYAHPEEEIISGRPDLTHTKCGALFVEFAKAFHGRQQLQWSRGLKDVVGVNEIDDEMAAEELEEWEETEVRVPVYMTRTDWYDLLKKTDRLQRLEILELAVLADEEATWDEVERLLQRKPDKHLFKTWKENGATGTMSHTSIQEKGTNDEHSKNGDSPGPGGDGCGTGDGIEHPTGGR